MMTIVRLAGLLRPYWKYLIVALLATLGDTAGGLLQPWPLKLVFDSVLQAMQHLSLSYHDERRVGDLLSTVTGDVQLVLDLIAEGVIDFVINVLTLVGMAVVMFAINWRFALLALSITPFLFVVVYRFTRRSKKASRSVRKQEGRISSMAQEVLSSMRVVQAYTREEYEQRRFEHENQQRVVAGIQVFTLKSALAPLVNLLVAVGPALVLGYGVHEVLTGRLTPGGLLVFLAYLASLYSPMRGLSKLSDVM